MRNFAFLVAAGLAMLVAESAPACAEDGGEAVIYTKPLVTTSIPQAITPWETRDTGFAAPDDEDKRLVRRLHYTRLISKYAEEYGVPDDLAHAVVQIESNFRPTVKGKAGEIGLMQVKPATARLMGYDGPDYGLYDPETNIRYGMKYLAGAHDLGGGKLCGTILKYNAGHAAKRMNPTSKRYCEKVQAVIAKNEPPVLGIRIAYGLPSSSFLTTVPLVF